MSTVAVVPIKFNSTRLPNKNIRPFANGKPLCWYIFNTLLQIESIDQVYVYCSNDKIKDYLPKGVQFLERSKELDQDSTKMNEVLVSFANQIYADTYIMTHATSPFVSKESINKGISAVKDKGYDSAFAAKRIQDFLWKDGKPFNYELDNIPRTQDLDPIFCETSGFYIYNYSVINNLNRRIGNKPYIVEVSEIESVDIDVAEDFTIAEAIYNYILCEKITGVE